MRDGHASVERKALASPPPRRTLDAEHPHPRVPPGGVGEDRRRPVGRAVVDGDDLEVGEGLRRQGREAGADAAFLVPSGDER
jgi:hypothetical protein